MAVVRRLDPAVAAGHERRADARLLPDLERRAAPAARQWLHTCYEPAIQRAYDDFHQVDSHRDYPLLTLPTLLIAAGKGGVIQPEDRAEIRALQPEIAIVEVENAGHMIPWDDFDGFFRAWAIFWIN